MSQLTPKRERFCQEIVKGKSQSDAYRVAFKPKRAKPKTIHEAASKIMALSKVRTRLTELMAPVIEKVQADATVTRAEWRKKAERFYHADVRKMYDQVGNVLDLPALGDNEAAMIAGFEVVEDFTKVKKVDGTEDAVPTGYTKKFKLVDPLKAHEYLGKVLGYYTEKRELSGELTLKALVLGMMALEQAEGSP